MTNILLIDGHPNANAFCPHLADLYEKSAKKAGHKLKRINVRELEFEPAAHVDYDNTLTKALEKAQEDILWAEHLVVVFPTWWADMPALLKGFFDHVFQAGFAFNFESPSKVNRLLKGRSARIISTSGAPAFIEKIMYPFLHKNLSKGTLGFCGIKPSRMTLLGRVRPNLDPAIKKKHENTVKMLGTKGR